MAVFLLERPAPVRHNGEQMIERYLSPFREFGPVDGLLYAVDRLLMRASPSLRLFCYDFMVQPVPAHRALPARVAAQYETRAIGRGDAELAAMPVRQDIREARLAQRATCLGLFRDGELAGYVWFAFSQYEEDEVRCTFSMHPRAASAFDFDLYVFPEHRMGYAFMAIWDEANAYLRSRQIRHTFSRLTRFNLASRRAHLKLGSRKVGRAIFLKAWRLQLMIADVAPYVHASWRAGSRVRIALYPDAAAPRPLPLSGTDATEETPGR